MSGLYEAEVTSMTKFNWKELLTQWSKELITYNQFVEEPPPRSLHQDDTTSYFRRRVLVSLKEFSKSRQYDHNHCLHTSHQ